MINAENDDVLENCNSEKEFQMSNQLESEQIVLIISSPVDVLMKTC